MKEYVRRELAELMLDDYPEGLIDEGADRLDFGHGMWRLPKEEIDRRKRLAQKYGLGFYYEERGGRFNWCYYIDGVSRWSLDDIDAVMDELLGDLYDYENKQTEPIVLKVPCG